MGNINGVRTEFLPEDGKFVVSFGKSVDIPVNSGDDISLRAYLIDNARETIISKPIEATCRMDSNNSVIWNTYRDFKVTTPLGSFLRVELLDSRNNEDIIGYTDIPINEYWDEDEHTFSMEIMKEIVQKSSQKSSSQKVATKVSNPNFSISLRRCFLIDPVPQRQVFFLVRHGESVWNRAQETGNMANLLKFDHSLTCRGVEQQCDLNKRWKSALSKGGPNGTTQPKVHPLESGFSAVELEQYYTSRFLHATHIYCSPLTRAIQSTLVGLRDHPTMVNRGITLYSVIREIKSAGGFDTGMFIEFYFVYNLT